MALDRFEAEVVAEAEVEVEVVAEAEDFDGKQVV
jgi:hypothetical protein